MQVKRKYDDFACSERDMFKDVVDEEKIREIVFCKLLNPRMNLESHLDDFFYLAKETRFVSLGCFAIRRVFRQCLFFEMENMKTLKKKWSEEHIATFSELLGILGDDLLKFCKVMESEMYMLKRNNIKALISRYACECKPFPKKIADELFRVFGEHVNDPFRRYSGQCVDIVRKLFELDISEPTEYMIKLAEDMCGDEKMHVSILVKMYGKCGRFDQVIFDHCALVLDTKDDICSSLGYMLCVSPNHPNMDKWIDKVSRMPIVYVIKELITFWPRITTDQLSRVIGCALNHRIHKKKWIKVIEMLYEKAIVCDAAIDVIERLFEYVAENLDCLFAYVKMNTKAVERIQKKLEDPEFMTQERKEIFGLFIPPRLE